MFKIGEFSKLTQVSIRMLRYYDEAGLLKPAETDKFTNYRLYTGDQILVLNKIVFLRDLHFNVGEIAAALEQWDNAFIFELLAKKRMEVEHAIKTEQDRLSKIELAQKDIYQEKIAIHYNVSIKNIPGYQVFSLRRTVSDYYAEGQLWKDMSAYAAENKLQISNNTFTIYHDTEYRENNVDMEICALVDKIEENANGFVFRITEPVPYMACTMVYGDFMNIAGAYLAVASWLEAHTQYRMIGQNRQIVHRGPWNEESSDHYLTEIQIPLERI